MTAVVRAMAAAVIITVAWGARSDEPVTPPERVDSFSLRDQHNDEHAVSFPRERPTVLALADRKGSEQLEGWLEPLSERYGETVHFDGVADVRGVPGVLRWSVRRLFRRGTEAPVMLDWEDTVCTDLAYEKRQANLLILDPEGRVVHRVHGEADEEGLKRAIDVIEELLEE